MDVTDFRGETERIARKPSPKPDARECCVVICPAASTSNAASVASLIRLRIFCFLFAVRGDDRLRAREADGGDEDDDEGDDAIDD